MINQNITKIEEYEIISIEIKYLNIYESIEDMIKLLQRIFLKNQIL